MFNSPTFDFLQSFEHKSFQGFLNGQGGSRISEQTFRHLAAKLCFAAEQLLWVDKHYQDQDFSLSNVPWTKDHDENPESAVFLLQKTAPKDAIVPPYDLLDAKQFASSIVTRKGVSVDWIRTTFERLPEIQVMISYGTPMWFVRNHAVPTMLLRRGVMRGTLVDHLNLFVPLQMDALASCDEGNSSDDAVNDATLFASYTGATSLYDFLQCLTSLDADEDIWCDAFSVDQHAWSASRGMANRDEFEKLFMEGLNNMIAVIGCTRLVLGDLGDIMFTVAKIWVIWEIFATVKRGAKLDLALRLGYRLEVTRMGMLDGVSSSTWDRILKAVDEIDVSQAVSWKIEDRNMIMDRVNEVGGPKAVSNAVKDAIRSTLFGNLVRQQMDFAKGNEIVADMMSGLFFTNGNDQVNVHNNILSATDFLARRKFQRAKRMADYCFRHSLEVSKTYFWPHHQVAVCVLVAVAIHEQDKNTTENLLSALTEVAAAEPTNAITRYAQWLLSHCYKGRKPVDADKDSGGGIFAFLLDDMGDDDMAEWMFLSFIRSWLGEETPCRSLMRSERPISKFRFGISPFTVLNRSTGLQYFLNLDAAAGISRAFENDDSGYEELDLLDPERWAYLSLRGIACIKNGMIEEGKAILWNAYLGCLENLGADNAVSYFILDSIESESQEAFDDIVISEARQMLSSAARLPKEYAVREDFHVAPWERPLNRWPVLFKEPFLYSRWLLDAVEPDLRSKFLGWGMRSAVVHSSSSVPNAHEQIIEHYVRACGLAMTNCETDDDISLLLLEAASFLAFAGRSSDAKDLFVEVLKKTSETHFIIGEMARERFTVFLHLKGVSASYISEKLKTVDSNDDSTWAWLDSVVDWDSFFC